MCDVMPAYACFVCVVMRFRLNKVIYFTILCFNNLFLRRYAYMLCNVSLNTPTTTKSLHIIFNTLLEQVGAAGGMTVRSESKDPKITTTTLITYIQLH